MATAKSKEQVKGMYMCLSCNTETDQTKCPQCGNDKLQKLAPDGIEQGLHGRGQVWGNPNGLRTVDEVLNGNDPAGDAFTKIVASKELEEMNQNLRESYVIKSEIKKTDLEMERLRKKDEMDTLRLRIKGGGPVAPSANNPGPANGNGFAVNGSHGPDLSMFGGPMNPQAMFVSQLMKMDKDKRQEFITQLGEADPQALATMSAMLAPYNNQMGWQGQGGNNPWNMPPWMMQQMYGNMMGGGAARETPPKDSLETAMTLITTIGEFMKKNSPAPDESVKELLRDISRKLEPGASRGVSEEVPKAVLDEIEGIKGTLNQVVGLVNKPKGVAEQVKDLNELVNGLEEAGLVKRSGAAGKSVEDEIRLKESDHKIKAEDRKLEIEAAKIESEKARADMGKALMTTLFTRSLNRGRSEENAEAPVKKVNFSSPPIRRAAAEASSNVPPEIFSETIVEGGVIRETRAPVKSREAS